MEGLAEEYRLLFETYESFNDQSLLIKGWSVTVGMAALIAAYAAAPADRPGRLVVFIAALSVVPFWVTDALWKVVQSGYTVRLTEIEQAFRTEIAILPNQSFATWEQHVRIGYEDVLAAMVTNATVLLPHAPIFALGVLLAAFAPPRPPRQLPGRRRGGLK